MPSEPSTPELLRGTLDMLILRVLQGGAEHGYGVARRIERASGGVLGVEEGSLYPALHRLARRGWLESERKRSENNRVAKYYRLTDAGRKRLAHDQKAWGVMSAAVSRVMAPGGAG